MSKKVELVLANTYVYKGKVFEKNKSYVVGDGDAEHLLDQRNERDIPYFRLSSSNDVLVPPSKRTDKGGIERRVETDEQPEVTANESEDAVDDSDAVTV
jgi:hypothetical protein